MMYAYWNTQWLSFEVYLNDSATNVCGLFFLFLLHLSPSLLRVLRKVLMQTGTSFIGIFRTCDLLKILGFNKKTSKEIWEKNVLPFPQCIIVDNKHLKHNVIFKRDLEVRVLHGDFIVKSQVRAPNCASRDVSKLGQRAAESILLHAEGSLKKVKN